MQDGQVITKRWMENIIADIAAESHIVHQTYSSGWVHVLKKDGKQLTFCGYKVSLNDAAASAIASDKVATFEILQQAGVAVLKHVLVRKQPDTTLKWYGHCDVPFVVKPLDGTSGHGVRKCADMTAAQQYMEQAGQSAWAVSPFIDIVREVRVIMLDGEVVLAYEKVPIETDGLKMFNLGLGATAIDIGLPVHVRELTADAMKALNLRIAAVDCIETNDGNFMVLEVNDGFMIENYMRQSEKNYQRGVEMYRRIVESSVG